MATNLWETVARKGPGTQEQMKLLPSLQGLLGFKPKLNWEPGYLSGSGPTHYDLDRHGMCVHVFLCAYVCICAYVYYNLCASCTGSYAS